MPTIGSGITVGAGITTTYGVTRTGLALELDAGSGPSYSPNVFGYARDIGSWAVQYGANNAILSRDTAVTDSPARGIAMKMAVTGNDPHASCYNTSATNIAPAAIGQTWTISVYVKASVATTGELILFGADATGNAFAANTYIAGGAVNIGTSWSRVSFTTTIPNTATATAFIQFRLDGTPTGGAGINIWWDGLQLELQSSATTFSQTYNPNGLSWYDTSGNIRNGTLFNSTTWSSDNSGSLVFNGSNNYVDVASSLGTLSNYTIMFWARRDAENRMPVAGRLNTAFYWYGDNSWAYTHGGAFGEYYYSKPTSIPLGTWGNYCVVYNGANVSIYRQGVYQGQQATTGTADWSQGMRIGFWAGGGGYAWQGRISQVFMYTTALSADQVAQNFTATRARYGI
jgi:hypothetical protein